MGVLSTISSPADCRALNPTQAVALCDEIRQFLITKISATGGHLGPNLGVVELTVAIHRVFESPHDAIIFDTGHQCYVHKLLTGRQSGFDHLRQAGGLSGYPSRAESEHDWFESSHASSALAYATGLSQAFSHHAAADSAACSDRTVVVVVGDGAMTGGAFWEAINNLSVIDPRNINLVLVINDNGRSYDETIGLLAQDISLDEFAATTDPVDGHDLGAIEKALKWARDYRRADGSAGLRIIRVKTIKAHGLEHIAGESDDCFHGVGHIDPTTGHSIVEGGAASRSWTNCFSDALLEVARENPRVVALTGAMAGPTGLKPFAARYPDRFFDVGIAEQYAMTSAAGLASGGLRPVVALYATFFNRTIDQFLFDVALLQLPVTVTLDRSGITGSDGPSHNGVWDLAIARHVPGVRIGIPRSGPQLRELLHDATSATTGPHIIRFPKGPMGPGDSGASYGNVDLRTAERVGSDDAGYVDVLLRKNIRREYIDSAVHVEGIAAAAAQILVVGLGPCAAMAVEAVSQLKASSEPETRSTHASHQAVNEYSAQIAVVDPQWALPICDTLRGLAASADVVIVCEDGLRDGGVGSALSYALSQAQNTSPTAGESPLPKIKQLGIDRGFLPTGQRDDLLDQEGLSPTAIRDCIEGYLRSL